MSITNGIMTIISDSEFEVDALNVCYNIFHRKSYRNRMLTLFLRFQEPHHLFSLKRENWLNAYNEIVFFQLYRMKKKSFIKLLDVICSNDRYQLITKKYRGGNHPVTPEKALLIFLCYMSKQDTLNSIADRFYLVPSTIMRIVNALLYIVIGLKNQYIFFPKTVEEQEFVKGQFKKYPDAIGAIDGSHINIKVPIRQQDSYTDRYMAKSINLMAICTAKNIFTYIFVGFPGSAHDARVFSSSAFVKNINNFGKQFYFFNDHHLIGDSAFPIKSWLMTPFKSNRYLSDVEKHHNYCICSDRVCIENTFGILKGRWRRLQEADDFKNHIICDSCVDNCRTVQSLQRLTRSSNGTLWNFQKDPQKYKKGDKFDLRLAPRFKDVPKQLEICRCCSEATRHVAIYLYDNSVNLLPLAHIKVMLQVVGVSLANLDETLNPILCCTCWQRLQVGYTFRVRLNLVTEKVQHYRKLLRTKQESKKDLNDIVHMWHNLSASLKEESAANNMQVCKTALTIKLKPLKTSQIKAYLKQFDLTISERSLMDNDEMPLLSPVLMEEETDTKKTNIKRCKSRRKKTGRVTNNGSIRKLNQAVEQVETNLSTRLDMKNQSINTKDNVNEKSDDLTIRPNGQPIKCKTMPNLQLAEPAQEILTDAKDRDIQQWNFDEESGFISDTDDEFVESTTPLNSSNDSRIISREPDQILDLDGYDKNPPLLELQEPCHQYNNFKMSTYSIDEKRFDIKYCFNQEKDCQQGEIQKKRGLSVRTDLFEPRKTVETPKTVAPLQINSSNKPAPARAVKIHSNEVIVPEYQLRKSGVNYMSCFQQFLADTATKQKQPTSIPSKSSEATNTPKQADDEFRFGDRIVMSFGNRPIIGSLKRQNAPEDGGSSSGKRPKGSEHSNYLGARLEAIVTQPETTIRGCNTVATSSKTSTNGSGSHLIGGTSNNRMLHLSTGGTSNNRVSQPAAANNAAVQFAKSPITGNKGAPPLVKRTGATGNNRKLMTGGTVFNVGSQLSKKPLVAGNGPGSKSTGNNRKPQLSKKPVTGQTGINVVPRVTQNSWLTNSQAPERNNSQTTNISFTTRRTFKKITTKVPSTSSCSNSLASQTHPKSAVTAPELIPYNTQKIVNNPTTKVPSTSLVMNSALMVPKTSTAHNVSAGTNFVANTSSLSNRNAPGTNRNHPMVQKVTFLENGDVMQLDQPMLAKQVSESRTTSNRLQLSNRTGTSSTIPQPPQRTMLTSGNLVPLMQASAKVKVPKPGVRVSEAALNARKLVPPASKKFKVPETRRVKEILSLKNASRPLSVSTTNSSTVQRPKVIESECILILSDDDEPNWPGPSMIKDQIM